MKVNILGAGPAGLYAAILIRQLRKDATVTVFEQNPPDATFGFGVVFSDQALAFLREDDAETAALIEPHMQQWKDITINHKSERIVIDGIGFSAIRRLQLLQLLQRRAGALGVDSKYTCRINDLDALPDSDLVIGADGLNSQVRTSDPDWYGEQIRYLDNRFIWYGCNRQFATLTQTFIESPDGPMNAHHYAYATGQSTFIVEASKQAFLDGGLGDMSEPESRQRCEDYFRDQLQGAKLIPNHSHWRQFPILNCKRWFKENKVLVGDALHTAHFSIGSGTRLAMEDVIALVNALHHHDWHVPDGLSAYQSNRQPVLEKMTRAAVASATWYDRFDTEMQLAPWEFALSYIRRAGRIDADRLQKIAPRFCQNLIDQGINLEITK